MLWEVNKMIYKFYYHYGKITCQQDTGREIEISLQNLNQGKLDLTCSDKDYQIHVDLIEHEFDVSCYDVTVAHGSYSGILFTENTDLKPWLEDVFKFLRNMNRENTYICQKVGRYEAIVSNYGFNYGFKILNGFEPIYQGSKEDIQKLDKVFSDVVSTLFKVYGNLFDSGFECVPDTVWLLPFKYQKIMEDALDGKLKGRKFKRVSEDSKYTLGCEYRYMSEDCQFFDIDLAPEDLCQIYGLSGLSHQSNI